MAEDYYVRECRAARHGEIGADRMAAGLPCIPDVIRGDLAEVVRLQSALQAILKLDGNNDLPDAWDIARAALKNNLMGIER